jgi:hypothetical protein
VLIAMIATKIVFLSLLSVSWMSAVSAAPYSSAMDIDTFLREITQDEDWTPIVQIQDLGMVETYFKTSIRHLTDAVDNFEKLDMAIRANRRLQSPSAPPPYLAERLSDLPRLVFVIRYYYLSFLVSFRPVGYYLPIVGMITPDYISRLSLLYRGITQRPEIMSYEVYTVDIAALLAMNNEMLQVGLLQNESFHAWLERYGVMILSLYQTMARYMRLQTSVPYWYFLQNMNNHIIKLEGNKAIRGYENPEIQKQLRTLSDAVLQVITIYGSPPASAGNQLISNIMPTHEGIRHYLVYRSLYNPEPDSDPACVISDYLMTDLSDVLKKLRTGNQISKWYQMLLAMVESMTRLANED